VAPAPLSSSDVLTYHNDNARSGQQLNETILTPANVNAGTFGKLFVISVDGKVDAEPLYAAGIAIAGGSHNVLVVATEHDSVYAFDADTGSALWHVSMLLSGETTSDDRGCSQVTPEIGVTATPVIDLGAGPHGTVYVVAMSKNGAGQYFQRLHALDLTTGAEQFGGPMAVQATFPGSGDNSSGGFVVFDPGQYKERPGLLLMNGTVYTGWSSHCDIRPYTGWMIGYNENTLAQATVLNVTPNGNEGSFWNSGAGPAADASGNIFALVANGTFDTTLDANGFPNQGDFGNAFLRISTGNGQLAVADYFAMFNVVAENSTDEDLGSGGALVVPDLTDATGRTRHLAVGAGKDANIYVADRDNMGKFNPAGNGNIYQDIVGALGGSVFSMPAYLNGVIYYGAVGDNLKAFPFSNALLASTPSSQSAITFPYPGATPSVSADGTSNGIVWAAENSDPAVLHAYDTANLASELYNSNQAAGGRDQFGTGNKFITPMIANGKVYVGTTNGVGVFGLLGGVSAPGPFALVSPANNATGVPASTTLSWSVSSGATSYDVHFGTSSPPPLATNTTGTSYTPAALNAGTVYYWHVVAKNSGGSTGSATWSFTTQLSTPPAPTLVSPSNGAAGVSLTPTINWNAATGATSYDVHFGTSSPPPLATNTTGTSYTPAALNAGTVYYWQVVAKNSGGSTGSATWSFTTAAPSVGLLFVPVTPCRMADTRNAAGPFGGPTMTAGSTRSFAIPQSACSIPITALAYSLNVTVVPAGPLGYLSLWPTGQTQPFVSTLNSPGGIVVANAALVPTGSGGAVSVYVSDQTDVVLDINGYFATSTGTTSYSFYPAPPCRIADTRGPTGQFGGPSMAAGETRDFPIPVGPCSYPPASRAYSLNVTVVPPGPLGYLTTWPTGQAQPNVSTLNSDTGKIVANAALVPGGTNESISVYVTDPTDAILDGNGYFAAPGSTGALTFYPVTPCRVADTRNAFGQFGGPELGGGSTRSFTIPAGACSVPATAAAYSLNVTVVPDGVLYYVTAWPAGSSQPLVSTLNSFDGSVVANAAIVPAGTNGAISIYVTNPTQVILDINGYFAP